ncbi:hypothetical protein JB92DRAFT_2767470 [Gautieria morchelliformis]|nr:hypothetical protein JB92DRAFT_2767470 [Gautieria morchelliformis]
MANLCLRGGCRQTTPPTYYSFYDTVLETLVATLLPMEIHLYTPLGEKLLRNDTIACMVGRVYVALSSKILMDAVSLIPYPGDPSSDDYEEGIPDDKVVVLWALGAVLNNAVMDVDSNTQKFNLGVSDYVWDGTKVFIIECVLLL